MHLFNPFRHGLNEELSKKSEVGQQLKKDGPPHFIPSAKLSLQNKKKKMAEWGKG